MTIDGIELTNDQRELAMYYERLFGVVIYRVDVDFFTQARTVRVVNPGSVRFMQPGIATIVKSEKS